MVGTIFYLVKEKGYGFIQSDDYDKNIFFHASSLRGLLFDDLRVGLKINFAEPIRGDKGLTTHEISK